MRPIEYYRLVAFENPHSFKNQLWRLITLLECTADTDQAKEDLYFLMYEKVRDFKVNHREVYTNPTLHAMLTNLETVLSTCLSNQHISGVSMEVLEKRKDFQTPSLLELKAWVVSQLREHMATL